MHIIAYDITDDRERLRVSRVLDGYGQRVQASVYQCVLDAGLKARLRRELDRLNVETGFIMAWCVQGEEPSFCAGRLPDGVPAKEPRIFII
ncbi:CRISPR-associated endonuclease Cas2 [Nitratidesulfovibrio liaohensis]|uniref:CRISPR-associated endonuclease Cas2 n=1 Tax=Nitratidesulfovibrio liaohensis TaxID=2604158 RepID=UPI0014228A08|nr:CRISPR-associated endonuclease Cas2 [Nitratidesulfovibrio liaohensis]NHZ45785.1 CRISPR-associated endonuclease Cas2 [Nitratidesulfovibrio liaohensis]